MIELSKNKMMEQPPQAKAESAVQEYHFGGSGKYVPVTVLATTIEEAEEMWKQKRKTFEELNSNERTTI